MRWLESPEGNREIVVANRRKQLSVIARNAAGKIARHGDELNTARSAVADLIAAAAAVHSARSLDRIAAALERLAPPEGEQTRKDHPA